MAIMVRSRAAVTAILAVVLVGGCGAGATPSSSQSPSQPPSASSPTPDATLAPAPSSSAATATATTYVIRKGDTMIAIAKRFHITLMALKRANPQVTDPTKLKIGSKLVIPAA